MNNQRWIRLVLRGFPVAVVSLLVVGLAFAWLGRVERVVEAHGTVRIRGYQVVRPQVPGFVQRVLVEPGQQVRAGDPLVELADPQFERELAAARQEQALVRRQLEYLEERRRAQGAEIDPVTRDLKGDEIEQARLEVELCASRVEEAEHALETARRQLRQAQELADYGLISEAQLRDVEQGALAAEQRRQQRVIEERQARRGVGALERELELLSREQRRDREELEAEADRLAAELEQWRRELERLGELERLYRLRALVDGVVVGEPEDDLLVRHVDPGDELFRVVDVASIHFVSQVGEEAVVRVRAGQPAWIELAGLPKDQFQAFAGRVEAVAPSSVAAASTGGAAPRIGAPDGSGYAVEIRLDRPYLSLDDGRYYLRDGMSGVARIAFRHDVPLLRALYELLTGTPQLPEPVPAPATEEEKLAARR